MPHEGDVGPTEEQAERAAAIDRIKRLEKGAIQRAMTKYRAPWARARRHVVEKALINHAFLNGFHYVKWTGAGIGKIPRRNRRQVRSVINDLKPISRILLSLLTRNKPDVDLTAATGDFVDEAAAQVGRKLTRHLERVTNQKLVNQHLWLWLMKSGTAFKRIGWDAGSGPPEELPVVNDDGEQLFRDVLDDVERTESEVAEILEDFIDEEAQDMAFDPADRFKPIMDTTFPGEVSCDVYSALEVLADPSPLSLAETDIVIIERVRSLDWIKANFGARAKDVTSEDNVQILFDASGSAQVLPGLGIPRVTGEAGNSRQGETGFAVVREMLVKPTDEHPLLPGLEAPEGVHFVWAGQTPLTEPINPLPYHETPETEERDLDFDLVDYRWFPEPGFWGSDLYSDLVPMVRSKNRRDSQIKETINAFAHPKGLMPAGSKIKKAAGTDQAGEWIEYVGTPPSYLEPPSVRPYIVNMLDRDTQHINDIAMTHEVLRQGRVPPSVRTADGLRMLQEVDSLAVMHALDLYETSEERAYQKMLDRTKQFYEDERVIFHAGERNRLESSMFKRGELFQYSWKVYVKPGSAMPDFRAAAVAEAREIAQFVPWMLVDPETGQPDRALFARLMRRGDLDEWLQGQDESRQTAELENARLQQLDVQDIQSREQIQQLVQQVVPVFAFDDHAQHLKQHYSWIRSPDFREMPQPLQTAALTHTSQHEQRLQQQAQQQVQQAAIISETARRAEREVVSQSAAAAAASEAREQTQDEFGQGQGQQPNGAQGQEAGGVQDLIRTLRQQTPQGPGI